MINAKLFRILPLLALLCLFSCEPNDSTQNQQNPDLEENFGDPVSRDFIGYVVDNENHAMPGVTVTIGNLTAQTDAKGVFMIMNADVREKFAYIKTAKAGYIDGSRALVPTPGTNNIRIMMIPSAPVTTISSGSQSEVSLPSGTKVIFDGAFQDESGSSYSGNVSVSMFHLKPSDENLDKLMPGMLYGQGENGEAYGMKTFGMLNVELRGSAGQKLNLKSGHTARIEMIVDATQSGTAPNTIPLWHFDESKGYWIEDGSASKQGNKYVGEVSHFSWWNCDDYFQTIYLTMNFVGSQNLPLSNLTVALTTPGGLTNSGVTNDQGGITGLVPYNTPLTVTIRNLCGDIIYTGEIGPFTSNTVLPTITINSPIGAEIQVSGKLTDCSADAVQMGYVMMRYNQSILISPLTADGSFFFTVAKCTDIDSFVIVGVDVNNSQYTGELSYTFSGTTIDLGTIPTCNDFDEFITFKVNEQPANLIVTNISHNWWFSPLFSAEFIASANQPSGSFPAMEMAISDNFQIGVPTQSGTIRFWYRNAAGQMTLASWAIYTPQITISRYDPPGGYVDFAFEGTTPSGTHISCNGHVLR